MSTITYYLVFMQDLSRILYLHDKVISERRTNSIKLSFVMSREWNIGRKWCANRVAAMKAKMYSTAYFIVSIKHRAFVGKSTQSQAHPLTVLTLYVFSLLFSSLVQDQPFIRGIQAERRKTREMFHRFSKSLLINIDYENISRITTRS